ncbi:hypothetical protein ABE28_023960 (plasmid) [Peribacillus muralis]|uniref:Uncharacterized protein n=1 Tax=Peribacillus muralis TaxID=264697 RepID=A0A1B3XW02_9BACI|nr:hypothetical protein [Peribacillus muralis]AOH57407.1 hypothetical protein ABE28_023960 [Peribacillus muralis]
MNINNWIPKLSESVKGIDNALYDTDLDLTIPLNNIARIIIKEMDGKIGGHQDHWRPPFCHLITSNRLTLLREAGFLLQ